jgi:endo-1,4-beta-xylanase
VDLPDARITPPATGGTAGSGTGGSGGQTAIGVGGAAGIGGRTGAAGVAGAGGRSGSGGAGGATGLGGATGGAGNSGVAKFVGNISTSGAIRTGFATYWSQFSPENEGKWGSVQPSSQTAFNWGSLDREYAYAQSNNIIFKQHNFIWGKQQPGWVNSGNAQAAVQAWMKAYCQRFPNTKLIDVVNEPPPHTTPSYISGMGGAGASGYDWIVNAFKWARAACPDAILILNDFNNIEFSADNAHTIDIVNRIKAAGAPIDAVGAQGHAAYQVATATVQGFIDKITQQTGLPVYLTEYDINVASDAQQMTIMRDQITMFWNDPNVKGITLWGYVVGLTWETNTGLQQSNGTMRPAMTWLMSFLGR